MKTFTATLFALSLVLAAGCTHTDDQPAQANAEAPAAKAGATVETATATPAQAAPATATPAQAAPATAAAGEHDGCGGEGECGGECGDGEECGCGAAMANHPPRNVPADAVWTTLQVKGMHCGGCAKKIETAVSAMDGVFDVTADYKSGEVRIATAPGTGDVRAQVTPAIDKLGYRVQ